MVVVVGMIAAVIALALLGRAVDSTADLIRLLRTPYPPAVAVQPGPDAASFDAANDASSPGFTGSAPDDVRSSAVPQPDGVDRARSQQAASHEADVSDARTFDGDDGVELNPVPLAAGTIVPDASTQVARQDATAVAEASVRSAAEDAPVRCGWRICPNGQYCCNWECSMCVSPGQTCPRFCGAPQVPVSTPCGPNTCNVTEVCCNPSCGICVPSGGTCSKEPCVGMYLPVSPTCGMNTCNVGQVCCNPSCGICTNPGETCSLDPCR